MTFETRKSFYDNTLRSKMLHSYRLSCLKTLFSWSKVWDSLPTPKKISSFWIISFCKINKRSKTMIHSTTSINTAFLGMHIQRYISIRSENHIPLKIYVIASWVSTVIHIKTNSFSQIKGNVPLMNTAFTVCEVFKTSFMNWCLWI